MSPKKRQQVSKDAASYVDHPVRGDQCSLCTMFIPPDGCDTVKGRIAPRGHCKFFEAKTQMTKAASDALSFFLPLTKIDKEKRTVTGYASTPALDLDGEVVSLDAVRKALPGYWEYRNIREMHGPKAVGVGKEANVDEKGLFLTAKIVDNDAWEKVVEGVYKGFSIGGRKLAKSGNKITEIEMIEISIVDRPANPECKFAVQKSAKPGAEAVLVPATSKTRRDPKTRALIKMAEAAIEVAKAAPQDGFQAPALGSEKCVKHGLAACAKCAAKSAKKMKKRDVGDKERESLASQGKALPGGGFPIANKKDLKNAIQAIGRSKNPEKTRKLIMRRAEALGATDLIPDKWKRAKLAKRAKKVAKVDRHMALLAKSIPELGGEVDKNLLPSLSAEPSFLVLKANPSRPQRSSDSEDFLTLDKTASLSKRRKDGHGESFLTLGKGMGTAGSMAYCFDSLRDIQRRLLSEAKREGGDKKDAALAKRIGSMCQELAAVIGQKADHEGAEALDLTDADDLWVVQSLGEDFEMSAKQAKTAKPSELDNFVASFLGKRAAKGMSRAQRMQMAGSQMKKAMKARKEAAAIIKAVHGMHKASYIAKAALAKAGKKKPAASDDDADDFDHQGAMEKLQKAFGELEKIGTFGKAARSNLKKAAGRVGQQGQEVSDGKSGFFEVPPGIEDKSTGQISRAGPGTTESGSMPPENLMHERFPGKFAKGGRKVFSAAEVDAIARAAAAEAKVETLEKMPAAPVHGKRPAAFDAGTFTAGSDGRGAVNDSGLEKDWFKGVDTRAIGGGDEELHKRATARLIGNMITNGGGKSIVDPNFHGTAGAGRA